MLPQLFRGSLGVDAERVADVMSLTEREAIVTAAESHDIHGDELHLCSGQSAIASQLRNPLSKRA